MGSERKTFTVEVEPEAMRSARAAVEVFAAGLGLERAAVADLGLAVAEAMFNAMDHGSLRDGRIHVAMRRVGSSIEVEVETGCDSGALAELERQLEEARAAAPPSCDVERGRGLFIIHRKTDAVRVEGGPGSCARIVLVKRIADR
jgi:anti-sigma regulatory factor (Ser/Thr protein kinase)